MESEYAKIGLDDDFFSRYFKGNPSFRLYLSQGFISVTYYAKKYPSGHMFRDPRTYGEFQVASVYFGNEKNFLEWKKSLLLDLIPYLDENSISYKSSKADLYLKRLAKNRVNELIIYKPYKVSLYSSLETDLTELYPDF